MDMAAQRPCNWGDEFDKQFLTMMTKHNQGAIAIAMAELVSDRATHPELETLAQNIIRSQQAEPDQFGKWLATWYNIAPSSGNMGGEQMGQPGMPRTGRADGSSLATQSLQALLVLLSAVAFVAGGTWLRRRA